MAIGAEHDTLRAVGMDVDISQAIFGMGTWETMIILVVALIFLGPDKLPAVAKSIGKGMRTLRRAMSSVEYEVQAMTQPDRYQPPPRAQASAAMNQRAQQAATQAAEAAEAAHREHEAEESAAEGPDGSPASGPLDADPEIDALLKAVHGDEALGDPHAPPEDYDLHRDPHHHDPRHHHVEPAAAAAEQAQPASEPHTVAAAHPYRPAAPSPAPISEPAAVAAAEPAAEPISAPVDEEAKAT